MPHQKSSDYKETAVQYYLVEDKTQEEVCKIFKCSRRSLMRWVKKYKTDGKITGYKRTPKAYKVHKEHVKFLLQEIKKNKTITRQVTLITFTIPSLLWVKQYNAFVSHSILNVGIILQPFSLHICLFVIWVIDKYLNQFYILNRRLKCKKV